MHEVEFVISNNKIFGAECLFVVKYTLIILFNRTAHLIVFVNCGNVIEMLCYSAAIYQKIILI